MNYKLFYAYFYGVEYDMAREIVIIKYDPAFVNEFKGKKRIRKKKMHKYIASLFKNAIRDPGGYQVDVST